MNFYDGNPAWLDVINAISALAVAAAAIFAAVFAARGLSAWRSELVGRRKYELAEEVLLAMRELQEVMSYIRSPISTGSEIAGITQGDGEIEEDYRMRATYSMAALRHQKKAEYFAKLRALQFRAGVILGDKYELPLDRALATVDEVLRAGHMGFMFARHFNEQAKRHWAGLPPATAQVDWASKMHEKEDIYYGTGGPNDKIATILKEAVKDAQDLFGPILKN